jgi:hypothetical protein
MITKAQAETVDMFHQGTCSVTKGPRGGTTANVVRWRRNGSTQAWKTRPKDFRIPVKYGMRSYGDINQNNAVDFHTEADCPAHLI